MLLGTVQVPQAMPPQLTLRMEQQLVAVPHGFLLVLQQRLMLQMLLDSSVLPVAAAQEAATRRDMPPREAVGAFS